MNELAPGFSSFPSELEPIDWIQKELTPKVKGLYGIDSYTDLRKGPKQRKRPGEYVPQNAEVSFFVPDKNSTLFLDSHLNKDSAHYPYRLLSPQSLLKIHSQFSEIAWLHPEPKETMVEMNEEVAIEKGINDGVMVKIYNQYGYVYATSRINVYLPNDVILVKQTGNNSINQLVGYQLEDENTPTSTHFYDSYVDIMRRELI